MSVVVIALFLVVAPRPAGATWVGDGVYGFGDAPNLGGIGGMTFNAPSVGLAPTSDGKGYWVVTADGQVIPFGDARSFGDATSLLLTAPIVGMAATPDGGGYWLVAMDGGVFGFGDAPFLGSTGAIALNQPIVGMASTPDGGGYWLVAMDGGVFAFGDAAFRGSTGNLALVQPVTGMAPTPDGAGYWLVASDGGVFSFGDALFHGSAVGRKIGTWVVGLAPTHDGGGYWLAAATGGVLSYGNAAFLGPTPNLPPFSPAAAIAATPDGAGYWLLRPEEAAITFAHPSSVSRVFPAGASAVRLAASQLGPNPSAGQGSYCNPYGPCVEWCAMFAAWAWEGAGIPIPRYAFTGDIFAWSVRHGRVLPASARPVAGDGVLFGTGPQNPATSQHVGIVAQVWPNGAIDVIEGDSGPEPEGKFAVTINGPFLPAFSQQVNGMSIYAFVEP